MGQSDDRKHLQHFEQVKSLVENGTGPGFLTFEKFVEYQEAGQKAWREMERNDRRSEYLEVEVKRLRKRVISLKKRIETTQARV
jgi:hypothetical protein